MKDPTRHVHLRCRSDGSYTIVQFTDLHWRDGCGLDVMTRSLVEMVLDTERPDLVVLTGDVIEGRTCPDPAAAWRQAVEPIEVRQIPWAAVFGNHDDEGSFTRSRLMHILQSCPKCVSEPGPENVPGVGNFVHIVQGARSESPAAVFYFLDSGSYVDDSCSSYAGITREQVEWLGGMMRAYSADSSGELERAGSDSGGRAWPPLGLVFCHIPLPEYEAAWRIGDCVGSRGEPINGPVANSGLYAALCAAGTIRGVFVGHDHLNDFDARLNGIRLCYGRATGYGSYGRDDFPRGARVIRLREREPDFTTWLRLDDGSKQFQSRSPGSAP